MRSGTQVISALCYFSPGLIQPWVIFVFVSGRLIEIHVARYMIYKRAIALDTCLNLVNIYPTLR